MKLKISLVSLLLAFVVTTSFAQEAKTYSETAGYKTAFKRNGAGDNWFIQLGAGVQTTVSRDNEDWISVPNALTLAPTFAVGKWFNPYLGFRLKGEGGSLHSFSDKDHVVMQSDMYYNGHFDLMWNMSNYFGKYNSKRVFSFIPYIGAGYYHIDPNYQAGRTAYHADPALEAERRYDGSLNGLSLDAGFQFLFRLSDHVGFHIDLAAMLADDYFDKTYNGSRYVMVPSATAGFTFNLGKTDFEVVEPIDYGLINDLNSKINSLRSENEMLSKRPVSCPECPKVEKAPVAQTINYVPNVVVFRINSAKVDANQQISINNTAQFVKNTGEKIKVVGYADAKTGTAAYNLKLSEQRAKAVAKELTSKYGISSDKIVVEWKGSGEQPYSAQNAWNRVVIMSAQ